MKILRKLFAESYSEQEKKKRAANLVGLGGSTLAIGSAAGYNNLANKVGTNKLDRLADNHLVKGNKKFDRLGEKLNNNAVVRNKVANDVLRDKFDRETAKSGLFKGLKNKKLQEKLARDLGTEKQRLIDTQRSIKDYIGLEKKELGKSVEGAVDRAKTVLKRKNSNRALAIGSVGVGLSLAARNLLQGKKEKKNPVVIDASKL